MSTDTTLTPRQQLVDLLCDDLNVQGWNQKNKIWFVKGEVGDEWLEFAGEFSGPPENHIVDLISKSEQPEDVTGLLVSTEGWAYPKKLTETFKTEAALRSYWRLVPPSEHPERVEIRHLLFASKDGEVIGLTSHHDAEGTKEWAALTVEQKCPTGDSTVDAARAFLGLNDSLKGRVSAAIGSPVDHARASLDTLKDILDTMKDVIDGKMTQQEATIKIMESMPEDQRRQMVNDMPDFIKDEFRKQLPEELRKKYGL